MKLIYDVKVEILLFKVDIVQPYSGMKLIKVDGHIFFYIAKENYVV